MAEVTTPERQLSYRYNFKGQRAEKIEDGQSRYYLYDQNNLLVAEIAADGSVAKEYIYLEGEPLAMLVDGQLYYYHNSHLGTPLLLSDAQQQVVWQAEYSAFGKAEVQVAIVENNLRFPGQYFDEETGLHYNYFRDYDPQTGRYLQSDPIGLAGGINTYGYVLGNPVSYIDPYGLTPAAVCLVPPITGVCVAGVSAVGKGVTAIGAAGIGLWAVLNKSAESKPEGCPTGTLPIDKAKGKFDLDKDDVHKIKDGIGAGPRDWTGISPDGRVWGGDGRGGAIDFGPLDIYIR